MALPLFHAALVHALLHEAAGQINTLHHEQVHE